MPISTSITNFDTISGFVYRACWMTEYLRATSQITPAQATAVIAAWNGQIKAAGPAILTLPECAANTQEALAVWWNTPGPQLKGRCQSFGSQLLGLFPEQAIASHPCSNWGTLILDFATTF
jgi:hypothetical protein